MDVAMTPYEEAFYARASAGIALNVKQNLMADRSSKQYKANKARQGRRWHLFKLQRPDASLDCIEDLKDFMLFIGAGMKGKKGDDHYFKRHKGKVKNRDDKKENKAVYDSVRNAWNNFCSWCADNGHPISLENKEQITEYNRCFLRTKLHLRTHARESKFSGQFHYEILSIHRWKSSHTEYAKPRVRFIQHHVTTTNFYSAGRIGEFVKSDGRDDPGQDSEDDTEHELRGLYFADAHMFAMFNEGKGKTELCIRLTKDEKGKGDNPQDRGHCTFYEDLKGPLYQNNFLFCLSMLLARMPFRDYQSSNPKELLQKLLGINIKEEQRFAEIHWKEDFHDVPFFECAANDSGKIEKASAIHERHKKDCYRAGLPNAPNFHDTRRYGLSEADKKYTESSRMRLGGHSKPGMFRGHYQPRETIDGAANFLGLEAREDVLTISQQLNIPYIPNLLQSLPAQKLYELQQDQKYKDILEQIKNETSKRHLDKLKRQLKSLEHEKLRWLRTEQNFGDAPSYEHEIYFRVRFMFSVERLRLETNLFKVAELRSEIGIQTILDLAAYYLQPREVISRPGLERSRCHCPGDRAYDWKHIYECHKTSQSSLRGFAEFCFLCSIWSYTKQDWEEHCQGHIDDLEKFPTWIDPLMYDGVLAAAGFCECCLINPRLPATLRMRQWTWRHTWAAHYMEHFNDPFLKKCCRHGSFDSLLDFKFHLYDRHGVQIPNLWNNVKGVGRGTWASNLSTPSHRALQVAPKEEKGDIELRFRNNTVDTMAMDLAERQGSSLTHISPKSEIKSLFHNKSSREHGDPMEVNESTIYDFPVEDTTMTESSEIGLSHQAIQSSQGEFIAIDDILSASTGHGVRLRSSSIDEDPIESTDPTRIGEKDDSQTASYDSGYHSPEDPHLEGLVRLDSVTYSQGKGLGETENEKKFSRTVDKMSTLEKEPQHGNLGRTDAHESDTEFRKTRKGYNSTVLLRSRSKVCERREQEHQEELDEATVQHRRSMDMQPKLTKRSELKQRCLKKLTAAAESQTKKTGKAAEPATRKMAKQRQERLSNDLQASKRRQPRVSRSKSKPNAVVVTIAERPSPSLLPRSKTSRGRTIKLPTRYM